MKTNQTFVVSKREILRRGMRNRCPNCGAKSLFKKGLRINHKCARCGLWFERDEGFFLGSMSINYTVTIFAFMLPILILTMVGLIPVRTGFILAILAAIGCPILFYRCSRSWWLMAYFYFLPHELPANRTGVSPHEDDA